MALAVGTAEGGVGFASGFGWSKFCFEVVSKLGAGGEAGVFYIFIFFKIVFYRNIFSVS